MLINELELVLPYYDVDTFHIKFGSTIYLFRLV